MHRLILTTLVFFLSIVNVASACEDGSQHPPASAPPVYSNQIVLSELFPVPAEGEEEFIELYNAGDVSVDIAGWKLKDASGKSYTIVAEGLAATTIPAHGFLAIPKSVSKMLLNNNTDSILLYQPDDVLRDETTYEEGVSGMSWSMLNGTWQWTTVVTKQQQNVPMPAEEKESDQQKDESASDEKQKQKQETSSSVFLNELMPNPTGSESTDEWIEIVNEGAHSVFLGGWQLSDQSTFFTLEDVTIAPGEYLVFEVSNTRINLNNTGDTLYLIDPFGKIIHGTQYENSTEGESWARDGEQWAWSSKITPGDANEINDEVAEEAAEPQSSESVEESETPQSPSSSGIIPITQARTSAEGTLVTVEGIVTVLPGILGTQYFYIQDTNAGIQIYSYQKQFPTLTEGDRVRVTGITSSTRGEARIKTESASAIHVITHEVTPAPRLVTVLQEELEGMLVRVEGDVVESSSTEATIAELISVVLKSTAQIDATLLEEGKTMSVVGIVSESDESYRMLPRRNADISSVAVESTAFIPSAQAAETTPSSPTLQESSHEQQTNQFILFVLISGAVLIAALQWQKKRLMANAAAPASQPKPFYTVHVDTPLHQETKERQKKE